MVKGRFLSYRPVRGCFKGFDGFYKDLLNVTMTTEESVKLCCQCSIVKWYSGPGEGESPYLDSEHELIGVMGIKYEGDLSSLVKGKRSKM